jgi:hypothetical protein
VVVGANHFGIETAGLETAMETLGAPAPTSSFKLIFCNVKGRRLGILISWIFLRFESGHIHIEIDFDFK